MNAELFALLTLDAGDVSLASLGRAIISARRQDTVQIRRAFLGPRIAPVNARVTTQRIRMRSGSRA